MAKQDAKSKIPGEAEGEQSVEPPEKQFGYRVSEARRAREWRQAEVAKRAGMSVNQVSRYETGDLIPGLKQIRRLADALEVSPSWLIYGTDNPFGSSGDVPEQLHGLPMEQAVPRIAVAFSAINKADQRAIGMLVFHLLELQRGKEGSDKLMELAAVAGEYFGSSAAMDQEFDAIAERMQEQNRDLFEDSEEHPPDA